jgi:putative acetyltransferase
MNIRPVCDADHDAIADLVRAAFTAEFGRSDEPELIARLRAAGDVVLERVAESDDGVVGHILFSRAWIDSDGARFPAVQMAPVSAAVGRQKAGVGSALIADGLDALAAAGETHVFVLGHPAYYPRFGFSAEAARAYESPWSGPHFMLKRLSGAGPEAGRLCASAAFG